MIFFFLQIFRKRIISKLIAAFHTQRLGNCSICLSGQKYFSCHICYENLAEYLRVKRQTEAQVLRHKYFQLRLMIKWSRYIRSSLQGLKEDLKTVCQEKLDDLPNFMVNFW